ncbi:MAG: 3-deoxy-8-phosphooctulonate synthase [Phycisphaerales bacterium]|nr:3-deoxy-8-phosphooctulonate synthase [Phycisphaerales bacterium]
MDTMCRIGNITVGPGHPLVIIAGPCVLEGAEIDLGIARSLAETCSDLGLPLVFKASFDKANRTSITSSRGPGLEEGLQTLARIKEQTGLPICTDVHHPEQAGPAAETADLVQVPAFLCRQTDLLVACARTGRAVNVKKGQFLSPAEMAHVIGKLKDAGCEDIMLTERGTFFGYHRLVNDFIGLGDMMDLGRPVCFDVTHSTQLPGAGEGQSAGRPDRADLLARAATAAGAHALFLECHPDPKAASSDAATVLPMARVPDILAQVAAIRDALKTGLPTATTNA